MTLIHTWSYRFTNQSAHTHSDLDTCHTYLKVIITIFGGYLNKLFTDFCAFLLLDKIKCFVFKCSRAMPARRAIKEIRSDASSSHFSDLFLFSTVFSCFLSSSVAFSYFFLAACLPLFLSHPLSVVGSLPGTMRIPSWKFWSFVQTPASKICPEKSLMAASALQTSLFAYP